MRTISSLGPRDVIHCPTVVEYMDIRTEMLKAGMARIPKPEDWTHSAQDTCILHNGQVSYLDYCRRQNYTVVKASSILVAYTEPDWDYEDRMDSLKDTDTLRDWVYLGIATSVLAVSEGIAAIRKFFTRIRKINL